jgi:hypothetical protein
MTISADLSRHDVRDATHGSRGVGDGEFWKVCIAAGLAACVNGAQKTVLSCLLHHADKKTGLCWPAQETIAKETKVPLRTVERAIADLLKTPYLSGENRSGTSKMYVVNFDALLQVWDGFQSRCKAHSEQTKQAFREKQKAAMASPSKAASLCPPRGEADNLGKTLAEFEWALKQNPDLIPDLKGWNNFLQRQSLSRGEPNAERALRLEAEVGEFIDDD